MNVEDDLEVEGVLFSDECSDFDSDAKEQLSDDVFSDDVLGVITKLVEEESTSFISADDKLEDGVQSRDSSADSSSSELLSREDSLELTDWLEFKGLLLVCSDFVIEFVGVSDFPE